MTAPLRVAHVITDSGVGGAEKILAEVATGLDPGRIAQRVIVLKGPGETAELLESKGVSVHCLNLPAKTGAGYLFKLPFAFRRLVRDLRADPPDILHCWLFQANLLGRLAASAVKTPVNISGLRVIERERMLQYPLDRWTSGFAGLYLAVSHNVAEHYTRALEIDSRRVLTIWNGLDTTPWNNADGAKLREELGIAPGEPVIGAAGRLARQKGFDILIRAAAAIEGMSPRLLIAGDGPEKKKLEALAKEQAPGRVTFLSAFKRVPEFMAAIDVFALASRWEGLPNTLLEAMAAAKPVVSTAVGGVPEVLIPGETGLFIPVDDHASFASNLGALLKDRERRQKLGEAGRARVETEFSLQIMLDKYLDLYQRLARGTKN